MQVKVFVERDMWRCCSLLYVISEMLQGRLETYSVRRRDRMLADLAPKPVETVGGRDSTRRFVRSAVRELRWSALHAMQSDGHTFECSSHLVIGHEDTLAGL